MHSAEFDSTKTEAGFTLVEVLIAMLIVAFLALGVAGLFGIGIRSVHAARNQTSTSVLAAQKMEQLRALTWGFDDSGQSLPVSDTTTNLSVVPPTSNGAGLNPSPPDTLNVNTPGYVDYLGSRGQWVGTGANPPPAAVYIRRWSIEPLPTNPNGTIVLQVLVTTVRRESGFAQAPTVRRRFADDALIASVKTRKAN
jgi:prepilin-type N-terminal cleavage/methylation domain-containing protein